MKTFETKNTGAPTELRLGLKGLEYADLYKTERLKELLNVFDCEVLTANPELFAA